MIGIKDLCVLDSLRVHDLTVEPKRVKVNYTVQGPDKEAVTTELIFSYDVATFDKKKGADVNLASMMAAQIALNYGLFFKEIVFDGLYDAADQRFLIDMMENTSREVLVMKFLSPNEFLKPPYDQVQPEKLARYTQAKVVFTNTSFGSLEIPHTSPTPDYGKYAILSSGGKDSLLTYGLVKELGEAHPVFVNESGRHWFTAVNAYRYFKEAEPNTRKPWTNCDRVFNWMVRQLPFIKENFQNIRADIYPIRMWNVAVFVFSTLPVVRNRGIGNVLIGNEYDTTVKGNFQGISYYNGLYDQSKYFDNALTRYYQKKGWHLYQYSLLRSLSELLILKILVKRYPDLQRLQVSCHAAHEEGGRMLPCGNCEKCRRIIGMLKALDEDPGRCGYTPVQIERGLTALAAKKVKQIGSDAAHLYHLLLSGGLIASNEHTRKLARPHPEILQLRFDPERSLLSDLPAFVRKPLMEIYDPYADGRAHRKDKKWEPLSPDEQDLTAPYFLKQMNNE